MNEPLIRRFLLQGKAKKQKKTVADSQIVFVVME